MIKNNILDLGLIPFQDNKSYLITRKLIRPLLDTTLIIDAIKIHKLKSQRAQLYK